VYATVTDGALGVLGHDALGSVDERGRVSLPGVTLDWWVGAHDRWHVPAEEASVRRCRLGAAPVWETTVRVPRGEVAQRVYAVAAAAGPVVAVDVENRSPVPLTVGFVVRFERGRVDVDGAVARVDGTPALVCSAVPRRWATGASTAGEVMAGDARTGSVEPFDAPGELALLFPVPHRTSVRAALGDVRQVDARELPAADAVARGWGAQLERGLQAELPPPVGEVVDSARADLLLATADATTVAALEDWGFDGEAAAGWATLGWRARRRARRRPVADEPWPALRAVAAAREPGRFLGALREVLAQERGGRVDLLPGFPPDWLGQSLTVSGMPLRAGTLSFAVRWHGSRPALLWDAPTGVELRTPVLDPSWSTREPAGETLLAEPPRPLLALGAGDRPRGESVDAPGQFS
jgi:hypothetical protein